MVLPSRRLIDLAARRSRSGRSGGLTTVPAAATTARLMRLLPSLATGGGEGVVAGAIFRLGTTRRRRRLSTNTSALDATTAAAAAAATRIILDDTTSKVEATIKQQEQQHPLYPKLFTPYQLPGIDGDAGLLPNRILMGSMHTGLEGHSMPTLLEKFLLRYADDAPATDNDNHQHQQQHPLERMATYFQRRARGGVGLMVTGGVAPNYEGWVAPFSAQLTNDAEMLHHQVVTQAVHAITVPLYYHNPDPQSPKTTTTTTGVPAKIVLQILHTGRYAYHPMARSAETGQSPISPFKAHALSTRAVQRTITEFVTTACLAQQAGYDGVEIMGSEGYLLSQFLSPRTNSIGRTDQYGGPSFHNRARFPLELVRAVRQAVGPQFIVIFRVSLWELVDQGMAFAEAVLFAQELQHAGVTILTTGIGWHESRIPTIASNVPRGAFVAPTKQLKYELEQAQKTLLSTAAHHTDSSIPPIPAIVSTNRINAPETIETLLQNDTSDLVSMARPFLADPDFILKAYQSQPEAINTCIACNQACLDHAFVGKTASCLVNPAACHEDELDFHTLQQQQQQQQVPPDGTTTNNDDQTVVPSTASYSLPVEDRINLGVIGAGPAGIAFACTAAELGHTVTLYERSNTIGGQFHMAKRVPGKEEFHEAIRYWKNRVQRIIASNQQHEGNDDGSLGTAAAGTITVKLNTEMVVEEMSNQTRKSTNNTVAEGIDNDERNKIDKWIVSTGVTPRDIEIPGAKLFPDRVLSYVDVLRHNKPVGNRVAVIGAGGIGFDVSEFLIYGKNNSDNNGNTAADDENDCPASTVSVEEFWKEWGVDPNQEHRGGLVRRGENENDNDGHHNSTNGRSIYLMQRKKGKVGGRLGRTTGWIHRASLKHSNQVTNIAGIKSYDKINENGNLVYTNSKDNQQHILEVDTVVLCAGQIEERTLELQSKQYPSLANKVYPIGGAYKAGELDAKRAIDMGTRLAHKIHLDEVLPGKHVFTSSVGTEEKLFRFMKKWM